MSVFQRGQVAVITGAASGIGRAAAEMFAERGMRLCLFDRSGPEVEALAARLGGVAVVGDVGRLEDVERLRDAAYGAFGAVHLLMNNAAIQPGLEDVGPLERWRATLDVTLWGVIHGVHAFGEKMLAQGAPAAIVNTGSNRASPTRRATRPMRCRKPA